MYIIIRGETNINIYEYLLVLVVFIKKNVTNARYVIQ